MACQTVVTQYILPLNQKCVCLEASHCQMPKLEAFPPLSLPMCPVPPNLLLALCVQILSQSMRKGASLLPGPRQLQGGNLTFLRYPLCARSCGGRVLLFISSSRFRWPHFREEKDEGRDGTRLAGAHGCWWWGPSTNFCLPGFVAFGLWQCPTPRV